MNFVSVLSMKGHVLGPVYCLSQTRRCAVNGEKYALTTPTVGRVAVVSRGVYRPVIDADFSRFIK